MQLTESQVQRSLAALENEPAMSDAHPGACTHADGHCGRFRQAALSGLPEGLLAQLGDTMTVRLDRLARARALLAHVHELSSIDLADRIVGRLVCDRLR
jgi:hypothetical protein